MCITSATSNDVLVLNRSCLYNDFFCEVCICFVSLVWLLRVFIEYLFETSTFLFISSAIPFAHYTAAYIAQLQTWWLILNSTISGIWVTCVWLIYSKKLLSAFPSRINDKKFKSKEYNRNNRVFYIK